MFAATVEEPHYNGMGVAHGGFAATLLDSALGCCINSMMPAGTRFTTLELKVNLTRPLTHEVGPLRCEARVVHLGSRTATSEGRIVDLATIKPSADSAASACCASALFAGFIGTMARSDSSPPFMPVLRLSPFPAGLPGWPD